MRATRSGHDRVGRQGDGSGGRSSAAGAARRPVVATIGALVVVLVTACGTTATGAPAGTDAPAVCEQPPVTGTADAAWYPETLDELMDDADLVVDARIVGEAGPAVHDGGRQPMAIAVEEVFRGESEGDVVLMRAQTTYGITGTPDTYVGAWDLEPWFCPGERYVLFLDRLPDGGYMALPRQGALRTEPPAEGRASTELVGLLRALDPDALRAEVRAAAARNAG